VGVCEPALAIVALDAEYEQGRTIYTKYASSFGGPSGNVQCIATGTAGTGSGVYTFGADLTATVPATARVQPGSGRLVPALVAAIFDETGAPTRDLVPGWYDTERNVDCSFRVAADGKFRCLPVAAPATLFFADASCQGPTRLAGFGGPTCGSDPRYALEPSQTCPSSARVYQLGGPKDEPLGSALSNGRCAQLPLKNVYPANEVDAASFVEASLTTE
jgi:hypothetical protein